MIDSLLALVVAAAPALSTVGEQSGFTRTGRYDEVIRLCDDFAKTYPAVRCLTFGTTPEGRPMKALVVEKKGAPAILVQGGIHAGEIDGKDAGFVVLRELLDGKTAKGVLDKMTLVFVPVFNVDGHERISKNNRPNQRGPEEMGWRTTSRNLNLNRDYMKADAPEMRAMLKLLNQYDPVVYVDLHVTDGAQFQHDVAVMIDPAVAGPEPLHSVAKKLNSDLIAALNKNGAHKALDFYPSFEKDDDPMSGVGVGVAPPRLSSPYWAQANRMGMLVETHSWKDYKTRVIATRDVLRALFVEANENIDAWAKACRALDEQKLSDVALAWDNTDERKTIDFLGYEYTRELSSVSGTLRTTYNEKKPTTWKLPFAPTVKPVLTTKAGAYIVPRAWVDVVKPILDAHGIETVPAIRARELDVSEFRASEVKLGDKPYEGRQTARVKGEWKRAAKYLPREGDLVVSTHQKRGRLVAHLFEPMAPDSFVSWGFFNAIFEQKEYMEGYVAEAIAVEMLRDPKVKQEFVAALTDPAFAGSPEKRLDFFYRRHPSYDARKDLYPVLRVE